MGLSFGNIGKSILNFGSKAYDQVNMWDEGRSWKTRVPESKKPDYALQTAQLGRQQRSGQIDRNTYNARLAAINRAQAEERQRTLGQVDTGWKNEVSKRVFGETMSGKRTPTRFSENGGRMLGQVFLNTSRGNAVTGLQSFGNYISNITDDIPVLEQVGDVTSRVARVPSQAMNAVSGNPINYKTGQIEGTFADPQNIENRAVRFIADTAGTLAQTANYAVPGLNVAAPLGTVGEIGQDNYDELIAKGYSRDEARLRSFVSGVSQAAVEKISNKLELGIASKFGKNSTKAITPSLKKRLLTFLIGTQKSGATEAGEEVVQKVIDNLATGKPFDEGLMEAAKGGYVGGVSLGVILGGVQFNNERVKQGGTPAKTAVNQNVNNAELKKRTRALEARSNKLGNDIKTAFVNNMPLYNKLVAEKASVDKELKRVRLQEKATRNRLGNSLSIEPDERAQMEAQIQEYEQSNDPDKQEIAAIMKEQLAEVDGKPKVSLKNEIRQRLRALETTQQEDITGFNDAEVLRSEINDMALQLEQGANPLVAKRRAKFAAALVSGDTKQIEQLANQVRTFRNAGKPKVVEKQKSNEYKVFRGSGENKQVRTQNDLSILGNDKNYYAFDKETAGKFGENVEETTVKLDNPLEITNDEQWRDITKKAGVKYSNPTGLSKAETEQWIETVGNYIASNGHDGVVVRLSGSNDGLIRDVFGSDQVVPFNNKVEQSTQDRIQSLETGIAYADTVEQSREYERELYTLDPSNKNISNSIKEEMGVKTSVVQDNNVEEKLAISKELNAIAEEQKKYVEGSQPYEELQLQGERLAEQLNPQPVGKVNIGNDGKIFDENGEQYDFTRGMTEINEKDIPEGNVKATVDALKTTAVEETQQVIEDIEGTGVSAGDFFAAVSENARNNVAIPDNMKPAQKIWDEFYQKWRNFMPEGVGDVTGDGKSWYPQQYGGELTEESVGAITLVSELDTEVQSYKERKNLVELGDIDYSGVPVVRTMHQMINNKFKDAGRKEAYIERKAEEGVEVTQEQAEAHIQTGRELIDELNMVKNKGGLLSSATEKMNLLKKLNDLGRVSGNTLKTVDKSLSWLSRNLSSSAEIYSRFTAEHNGEMKTINEIMGFDKFLAADPLAITMNQEVNNQSDVTEYFSGQIQDYYVTPEVKERVTVRLNKTLQAIDGKLARLQEQYSTSINPEEQAYLEREIERRQATRDDMREHAFARALKDLSREQAIEFAQNYEISDPQLAKNIDHDLKRMLLQDATTKSVATKIVNAVTGIGYQGALGWNITSAFQNLTETKRIHAEYGAKEFAIAVRQAKEDFDIVRRYGFTNRNISDPNEETGVRKSTNILKPLGIFDATENMKDAIALHAAENRYKAQGLTGTELTEAVYHEAQKFGLKYGQGGSLGYTKSKTGRLFGQFSQYGVKETKLALEKLFQATGKNDVTKEQRREAQKYIARLTADNAGLYLILSALMGYSWEYVWGVMDPLGEGYTDKDAPIVEKAIAQIPGGPIVSFTRDLYLTMQQEFRDAEEEQRDVNYSAVASRNVKKGAATLVPGGHQFFNKTGNFVADRQRGYNEDIEGKARFATGDLAIYDEIRGLIGGTYKTNPAREYFGTQGPATDFPVIGKALKQDRQAPVTDRVQEKINEVRGDTWTNAISQQLENRIPGVAEKFNLGLPANKVKDDAEIQRLISVSREMNDARKKLKVENPDAYNAYINANKYTFNKDTQKFESDVISPEKWKALSSDESGKAFEYAREKALKNAKEFGDLVDPIYELSDKREINEILALRSMFTGDDREKKALLNKEEWYQEFKKKYDEYGQKLSAGAFEGSDKFGNTARKDEYLALSKSNPAFDESLKSDLLKQYEQIRAEAKAAGEDSAQEQKRKDFYKANADALSAEYEKRSDQQLEWTNKMRKLEGANPISKEVWENETFGYNDDEEAVAKRIAFKYGKFYSEPWGSSKGKFEKNIPYKRISTGRAGAPSRVTLKVKAPTVKMKQRSTTTSKPKVSIKKSLV